MTGSHNSSPGARFPVRRKLTGHRESSHEQSDVSSPDHDALTAVSSFPDAGVLVLPGGPDPHEQNEDVKENDGRETLGVDGHFCPRDQMLLRAEERDDMERSQDEERRTSTTFLRSLNRSGV